MDLRTVLLWEEGGGSNVSRHLMGCFVAPIPADSRMPKKETQQKTISRLFETKRRRLVVAVISPLLRLLIPAFVIRANEHSNRNSSGDRQ
jgi:hypothetical protein